jgi:SPP1 family predicted phage head-tail adaptor
MISDLNHRLTLQELTRVGDSGGGFTETWHNVTMHPIIYAEVTAISGAEQLRFHQMETTATHRIVLRYRGDLIPRMRLIRGDTAYNIMTVGDKNGDGRFLEVLAQVKSA